MTKTKSAFLLAAAASALLVGCTAMSQSEPTAAEVSAYFQQDSDLPFHAPDFTRLSDEAYKPAIEEAMALHAQEIDAIVNNPEAPTFENTVVALESSGAMLGRIFAVFGALVSADTNDTLDAIDAEMSPRLTAHFDAISLNPQLFERVKSVYDNRAAMTMTPEDAKLLEETYDGMVHAGALLTDEQKESVKAINARLSELTTEYSQLLTAGTNANALVVDTREELAGLSDGDIEAAAKLAGEMGQAGKFALALQNTTQQPSLSSLTNRATREALFAKSFHRADAGDEYDTRMMIAEIAKLRADKAALFGAPNWAAYTMYDRMAKEPKTALDFMEQMVPALSATQRREAGLLNAKIAAEGGDFTVEPWDWQMFADKVKAERYAFNEEAVKPYFEVTRVLEDGVFFAAEKLYGLTFEKRDDIPVYNDDVTTYTVFDRDGSELGLFYFDPFQRPSKRGGAWMSNFVDQSHLTGNKPVIYNVLNIPKAPEGEPQLVSFDNVETMFHEFGHALHGFFADQRYESLSGTATARDFVEYPSQVNEIWASYPEVLANYAKHYQTGEVIPGELIEKIQAASKWNQGYEFGEVVAAALLDMKWHALSPAEAAAIDTPEKVDAFERKALTELGLEVDLVPPRYRSSYFRHIFSSPAGYSAGYYSYLWTEMLDRDSRKWFRDNGGLVRKNGDHFRETVLSRGGTMDYFEMFDTFAGREPDVTPMLEARGLTGGGE